MEYLEGGTLRRRLDAVGGGLGFWPAAKHALELAAVMKYMHEEAIPERQATTSAPMEKSSAMVTLRRSSIGGSVSMKTKPPCRR